MADDKPIEKEKNQPQEVDYFEELLTFTKMLLEAQTETNALLKAKNYTIEIEAPVINVPEQKTPEVHVEQKEVKIDLAEVKAGIDRLIEVSKQNKPVVNPKADKPKDNTPQLLEIAGLLQQLLDKDNSVVVDKIKGKLNVAFPDTPKAPISVRLSNGKEFYAVMGAIAQGASFPDEIRAEMMAGFRKEANITTTVNGNVITETDGSKTKTTTVNGNQITEVWS